MAVYHLTNRESNITFRIADTATVITMEVCRWAKPDIQHMDVDAARKMYSLARKFGFKKGYTRHQSMRKITTDAQYSEWVKKTFDFYNNDNDAEAELAMQETFVGQGYIEVFA